MNTRKLYRIFGFGILILILIAASLFQIERHLGNVEHARKSNPPETSPLSEVEFESGALALRLKTEQEKRLNGYRGNLDQDTHVEVPLERAVQAYLKGAR